MKPWHFKLGVLFAALACMTLAASAGSIEGSVRIQSQVGPKRVRPEDRRIRRDLATKYRTQEIEPGEGEGATGDEEAHVVLHLLDHTGRLKAHPRPASANRVEQKSKQFVPHVFPVVRGSTVTFANGDGFFHHIFSPTAGRKFEIPRHINSRTEKFEKCGPVELFCGIHPRMNAYVYVVDNDYFAQPAGGNYAIPDIPAGKYTLRAWHPRLPEPRDFPVEVPAKGTVTLDVVL